MGLHAAGEVVFLIFPFSDLSGNKLRPVVLLAAAGQGDWISCQITSNPSIDPLSIPLTMQDFSRGGLRHISYARPAKLFTAHESLIGAESGLLKIQVLQRLRDAVIATIRA